MLEKINIFNRYYECILKLSLDMKNIIVKWRLFRIYAMYRVAKKLNLILYKLTRCAS